MLIIKLPVCIAKRSKLGGDGVFI